MSREHKNTVRCVYRTLWYAAACAACIVTAKGSELQSNVIVPETNALLNDNVFYKAGELAIIPDDANNIAEMFVGGTNNKPLQVIDTSAMRSQRTNKLLVNRFSIQVGDGVSTPSNGVYQVSTEDFGGDTSDMWVRVYPLAGATITDVTFEQFGDKLYDTGGFGTVNYPSVWKAEVKEGYVEFTPDIGIDTSRCGWLCNLTNIECYEINRYQRDYVNDTSVNKFYIKDREGTYDLYDLRRYLIHYWDGNRGANWSDYLAMTPVRLDGNAIRFTDSSGYHMQQQGNDFVFKAGASDAFRIYAEPTPEHHVTNITMTAMRIDNNANTTQFDTTFECDTSVTINWPKVKVCYTESLEPDEIDWTTIPYTYTAMSPATSGNNQHYTLQVSNAADAPKGFYRVTYYGLESGILTVVFSQDVKFLEKVYIKGDDGVLYRIKANAGALSLETIQ